MRGTLLPALFYRHREVQQSTKGTQHVRFGWVCRVPRPGCQQRELSPLQERQQFRESNPGGWRFWAGWVGAPLRLSEVPPPALGPGSPRAVHSRVTGARNPTSLESCLSLALLPPGCVTSGKSPHLSEVTL